MVLNGKAELAAKAAQAAKIRYERVEWCVIVVILVATGLLGCELYRSMGDGWQLDGTRRWHVLLLSATLLVLSIVSCIYLMQRLQPSLHIHPSYTRGRGLLSVNSELSLLVRDRPPSYDAVIRIDAPPPYNIIFSV